MGVEPGGGQSCWGLVGAKGSSERSENNWMVLLEDDMTARSRGLERLHRKPAVGSTGQGAVGGTHTEVT